MPQNSQSSQLGANHHYVPQSYLKRFGIAGNPDQVFVYESNRSPYVSNVRNVASQRDFYTFTDPQTGQSDASLEEALGDVDAAGITVIGKLDDMPDGFVDSLSNEDKGNLLAYIAFQHTRNLQERKMVSDMYDQMMGMTMVVEAERKESFHEMAKQIPEIEYDYDSVERQRQMLLAGEVKLTSSPLDQHYIGAAMMLSRPLYEILFTRKKMVLVSTEDGAKPFVTSDNPVTHYLIEDQKKVLPRWMGVGYINAVFQFPISPTRCLLLINEDMKMDSFKYDDDAVNYINYHTYYFADRWVFADQEYTHVSEEFDKFKHKGPFSHLD
jgi:hypothetical protein